MFEAVSGDAVAHYRQSGWLRADERAAHEERTTTHPSQAPPAATVPSFSKSPATSTTDGS
jgi:hypothetical protein